MEIIINNQTEAVKDNISVKELMESKGMTPQGVGVAVNDTFIPHSKWAEKILKPNDSVVIIKAAYGG